MKIKYSDEVLDFYEKEIRTFFYQNRATSSYSLQFKVPRYEFSLDDLADRIEDRCQVEDYPVLLTVPASKLGDLVPAGVPYRLDEDAMVRTYQQWLDAVPWMGNTTTNSQGDITVLLRARMPDGRARDFHGHEWYILYKQMNLILTNA